MANDVKYAKTDQALRRLTLEQYRATQQSASKRRSPAGTSLRNLARKGAPLERVEDKGPRDQA